MTEFQKLYYCFDAVKLNRYIGIDGATSLIREKWQPACLAGNLKSIRYKTEQVNRNRWSYLRH
jgi:hypothetical protein